MTDHTKQYVVFLSYSYQDRAWVSQFTEALTAAGIHNWFDIGHILPGENWQEKLEEALREAEIMIIFLSEDSVQSPNVLFELGAAVAGEKKIIPVLIVDNEPQTIPAPVSQLVYLRANSPTEAGKRVAEIIEKTSVHGNED
jgi:hypothetical protein